MRTKLFLPVLLMVLLSACHQPDLSVYSLVCEGLTNPLGIARATPRFGRKVASQLYGTGSWFYHAIGGIRPLESAPTWRKVSFGPQIPDGVTWAKTFKITPDGKISANWELAGDNLSADLEILVGKEAEVDIPPGETRYTLNVVEKLLAGSEKCSVVLKSGQYKISYKI